MCLVPVQAYFRVYKEHIPVAQLCREIAATMQEFTREPQLLQLCQSDCSVVGLQHSQGLLGVSNRVSEYQTMTHEVLMAWAVGRVGGRAAVWCVPHACRLRWTTALSSTRSILQAPTLPGRPVRSARIWCVLGLDCFCTAAP